VVDGERQRLFASLRVYDSIDFVQIAMLKTKQLTREKVANFQKSHKLSG